MMDIDAAIVGGGIPIAMGGWAVLPLLIDLVFGDAYATSAGVLAIVIWSMPVVLVRSVLQAAVIAHGSQQYALRATFAAALSNVLLNVVAVPLPGMHGAALTTVVRETIRMAVTLMYVRRLGFPATSAVRFARSGVAAVGMGALLLLLHPTTLWAALPLGVLAYVVALTLAGGLRFRRVSVVVTV
jgi:O-antigen/teichoic acid export membrane protein